MTEANDNVIDMTVIETLRELGGDDDPGLVGELIDLYLLDAPDRLRELEQALEERDVDLLERAAHTLKSASANIGAIFLSDLCQDLECLAREASIETAGELVAKSLEAFDDAQQALAQIQG